MAKSIPEGYTLQNCEDINVVVPMPDDWCFWQTRPGEYLLTRERIELGDRTMFETGLTLSALRDVSVRSDGRFTSTDLARRHAETPPKEFQPTSELEIATNGDQEIFRRTFATAGAVLGLHLSARSYYLCGIADPHSDITHIATFETPNDEWGRYRPVAEIMIHGIRVQ